MSGGGDLTVPLRGGCGCRSDTVAVKDLLLSGQRRVGPVLVIAGVLVAGGHDVWVRAWEALAHFPSGAPRGRGCLASCTPLGGLLNGGFWRAAEQGQSLGQSWMPRGVGSGVSGRQTWQVPCA